MSAAQTGFWVPLKVYRDPKCLEWFKEHGLGDAHSCFLAGEELPDGLAEDLRECFMNEGLATEIEKLIKEYGDKPDFALFLINAMKKPYQDLINKYGFNTVVWSKDDISRVMLRSRSPELDSITKRAWELVKLINGILKIFPEEVLPLVKL